MTTEARLTTSMSTPRCSTDRRRARHTVARGPRSVKLSREVAANPRARLSAVPRDEGGPVFDDVEAVVQAAGDGERLGRGPKAFLTLGGQTLLERAVGAVRAITD